MLDRILQWDREAFVYLNRLGIQQHDFCWSTVTKHSPWIPIYVLFLTLFCEIPQTGRFYENTDPDGPGFLCDNIHRSH